MTELEEQNRLTSRSIRSFVIRNGRLTKAQALARDRLLPLYGIAYQESLLAVDTLFEHSTTPAARPLWVEIGFGNGDALLAMAAAQPDTNFIGIEVHEPGVGQALMGIESMQLSNVRLIQHDAMEVLQHMIPDASLDRVLLYFPDPWRKKRHFKRRIVQKEFVELVANKLHAGGVLHCATDWENYAHWMVEKLSQCDRLANEAKQGEFSPRPHWRTKTRFEQRGERLGHDVFDLLYRRL